MSVTVMGYDEAIETLRGIDIAMRARIVRSAIRRVVWEAASEMKTAAPDRTQCNSACRLGSGERDEDGRAVRPATPQ